MVCLVKPLSRQQRELPGVEVRLAGLPDPRHRRGRWHTLASVLLTGACAVLAGARSYRAIGQWARHARQDTLARLGFVRVGRSACAGWPACPPCAGCWSWCCPRGLADLLGHGTTGTEAVAVDGKSARGSRTDTMPAVPPAG
ncbi:transposase family protein [Streptomyces sp. NPDC127084]|uniref:transposase family protein n=1 Tax=Streptomyces sp. NPDC127084 TaxID=3347133 RepID=UPI0036694374